MGEFGAGFHWLNKTTGRIPGQRNSHETVTSVCNYTGRWIFSRVISGFFWDWSRAIEV